MCRTYRQLFLQAVVEVFGLVGLQLLQRDSGFADELIVAEFILVAHRDPVDSGREGRSPETTGRGLVAGSSSPSPLPSDTKHLPGA